MKKNAHSIQCESCVLPRSSTAPSIARGFVCSALASWSVDGEFVDAPLLASELVTNAVRHGRGEVGLSVLLDQDRVRVAVVDDSDTPPVMREPGRARDGGWGLNIVERLSSRWGLEQHARGKTVWCEVLSGRIGV